MTSCKVPGNEDVGNNYHRLLTVKCYFHKNPTLSPAPSCSTAAIELRSYAGF